MKNRFPAFVTTFLIILLIGCELEISESDVPKDLVAAFKARYPNAQQVSWEAEKADGKFYYEASWKENGKEAEVHISPDGVITPAD